MKREHFVELDRNDHLAGFVYEALFFADSHLGEPFMKISDEPESRRDNHLSIMTDKSLREPSRDRNTCRCQPFNELPRDRVSRGDNKSAGLIDVPKAGHFALGILRNANGSKAFAEVLRFHKLRLDHEPAGLIDVSPFATDLDSG